MTRCLHNNYILNSIYLLEDDLLFLKNDLLTSYSDVCLHFRNLYCSGLYFSNINFEKMKTKKF